MWKVLRIISMILLAGTAVLNLLIALVLFVGGDLLDTMGKHTDEVADHQEAKDQKDRFADPAELRDAGKEIRDTGKDVKQIAGWVALMAIAGMVAIAFVSNRERVVAPIAAGGVLVGEILFGRWSHFSNLVYAGMIGAALALLCWYQLRASRTPDSQIYG
jgi:hypothetical protein